MGGVGVGVLDFVEDLELVWLVLLLDAPLRLLTRHLLLHEGKLALDDLVPETESAERAQRARASVP